MLSTFCIILLNFLSVYLPSHVPPLTCPDCPATPPDSGTVNCTTPEATTEYGTWKWVADLDEPNVDGQCKLEPNCSAAPCVFTGQLQIKNTGTSSFRFLLRNQAGTIVQPATTVLSGDTEAVDLDKDDLSPACSDTVTLTIEIVGCTGNMSTIDFACGGGC
jgi:hypothetical protein